MRARSSTGWTSGAATYDSGLVAHNLNRPAPRCSALLSGLVLDSHLVPSPVAFSRSQTAHGYRTWPGTASSNARYPQHNHARYDAYGNMWVTPNTAWGIAPAGPTSNVYNNNNQASTLSYDGSGRVTSTGSTSFSYDAENRQTQATDAPGIGGGTVTYAYDGAGERVKKQISGGAATISVHDAYGQLAAEYSIAQNTAPCVTCYVVSDHLGSTRLLTDQNGNVVARHDFQPFGEEIQANQAGRG